jgi:glycosyltransferase involved in cell wall biosynthesis
MKIIIIGPAYPYRGGIADTNESLCRALTARGDEASIITFQLQYPESLFPGKTQYSTGKKPDDLSITRMINSINPFNWIVTARKINKMAPDIVVFRYWVPFLSPALGTIARLLKKNIVKIALCDNVIPHEHFAGSNLLTSYFINKFDGFITLSKAVLNELEQFTEKPRIYFPHPINDNLGEKLDKIRAREFLNLDAGGKYILFFGLVRKYKGLDLLLKAMGEDAIKKLNVKLIVAGEFYDSPGYYYDIIDEYGIGGNVIIRNEFIPASEIKYYFSAADLVTQTYHTASQSGVTQIAYNFDCPILVTDVGGLSETVLHNKTGYVVSKEPREIAKYIVDFFENKRGVLFSENIKAEKSKYSWSAFAGALMELYKKIV